MFSSQIAKLRQEIATIQACARLNAEYRALRFGATAHSTGSLQCPYELVSCPNRPEWAIYDHCAAVTRVYAVYERFVEDIVTLWLDGLPPLFPKYSELPKAVRTHHVAGASRVLPKVGDGRYKHLTVESTARGVLLGAKDDAGYDLPFELFAITERNLRLSALQELMTRVGIDELLPWLERHSTLQEFMTTTYAGQETVDSKLNALVTYRNEAAHGEDIAQVLGLTEFLQLCAFIESLCKAVAERICRAVCERRLSIGTARVIGSITEEFRFVQAVVGKFTNCTLKTGMEIVLLSNSTCHLASIKSLQLNGTDAAEVVAVTETEVGVKFSSWAKEGTRVLMLG